MKLLRRKNLSLMIVGALGVLFANSRPACADAFNYAVFAFPGARTTLAEGINNSGDIVGAVDEPYSQLIDSEFLYQGGNYSLFPGIVSISNNGMILFNSPSGPAIFFNEMVTPVNVPGAVIAINNKGSILVSGGLQSGSTFHPINFPGSGLTTLSGINDLDEVVGSYVLNGRTHGFLYSNGVYTTIDFPGAVRSHAYAINNNGEIVGNYFFDQGRASGTQGFLYVNGDFQTLNAFNFVTEETITVPRGINDFGEVTGYQFESFGGTQSFVATPVPEPESLSLVATGLMMIARVVRRRSRGFASDGVPPIVP